MRPRQKLHTSDLAYKPAVHVFTDEPSKATDEHTPLIFLKDDQPKAPLACLLIELSETSHWSTRNSERYTYRSPLL